MNTTSKCPMCAETIKAEAKLCRFCEAKFEVSVKGYCTNCHAEVTLNENDKCSRCGGEIVDRRIASTLISEPAKAAALGAPFPGNKQMNNYWGSFGDLFNDVLSGGITPQEGVQRACDAMNSLNGLP